MTSQQTLHDPTSTRPPELQEGETNNAAQGGAVPGGLGKLRVLDLYCAAGGAGMGYSQAGFEVVGVDHNRQPNYPFTFIQADCLTLDMGFLRSFDAIHASPPCQTHTRKTPTWGRARVHWPEHLDLIPQTRALLIASGLPYVIENVVGAPLKAGLILCGTMFGLRITKHRAFESNIRLPMPPHGCDHRDVFNPWQGKGRTAAEFREAQGTPWIPTGGGASRKAGVTGDLYNAIPPAFTKHIGAALIAHLMQERVAA
jgi:DNA (cytosine-5)-methyltransferase 1